MSSVLFFWSKANWMSKAEVNKELKRVHSTCLSFGMDLEVVDLDGSIVEMGNQFGFPVLTDMSDVFDEEDPKKYVLLEPENKLDTGVALKDYSYRDDVVYVLWSEYGTIPFEEFPADSTKLFIETIDERPLWALSALSILLYDRFIKCQ